MQFLFSTAKSLFGVDSLSRDVLCIDTLDMYSTDQLQLNKPLLDSGCSGVDTDTRTIADASEYA
jgi:hypothetical protein